MMDVQKQSGEGYEMIKILKVTGSEKESDGEYSLDDAELEDDIWINVIDPRVEEIKALSQKLGLPVDFFTAPLDVNERPRIEVEENSILIIIRTAHCSMEDELPRYSTIPLGIIVASKFVITVCSLSNEVIEPFVSGKVRGWSTAKRNRFVLQIFSLAARIYLTYLGRINHETSVVEERLHESMRNKEIIELLHFEKSLVYFTTSLTANELVMERLQKLEIFKMYPDDKDLLEDVIIENKQAIEMANIHSNILSGMMDAFASVISNNLNIVMKFLTSITIILMLPTLVASIYGMNIKLPMQKSPHAFVFLMVFSLVLSVLSVIIFAKRKWF